MANVFGGKELSPAWLLGGSFVLLVGVGTLAWFAIPGPRASHDFASPSGAVALEVDEACEETCRRRIVAVFTAADGSATRRLCTFDLPQAHPVLLNAWAMWAEDERSVDLVYADSDGEGGKLTLSPQRDCITAE